MYSFNIHLSGNEAYLSVRFVSLKGAPFFPQLIDLHEAKCKCDKIVELLANIDRNKMSHAHSLIFEVKGVLIFRFTTCPGAVSFPRHSKHVGKILMRCCGIHVVIFRTASAHCRQSQAVKQHQKVT